MSDLVGIKKAVSEFEENLDRIDAKIVRWSYFNKGLKLAEQSSDVVILFKTNRQSAGFSITRHDVRTYSNVRDNKFSRIWAELQSAINSELESYKAERKKLIDNFDKSISLTEIKENDK